ncbi:hypothetical protein PHPALM_13069 [Phytophthora palmivora]|uniref:Uncharacterized protein n=1 Tax=Phytophthora palmivora TaxID=4796 RepID=A0A2P4XYC2_9STRA|nr:hypothetical protein PHPALM_13069 [Phytophthora palmivora]
MRFLVLLLLLLLGVYADKSPTFDADAALLRSETDGARQFVEFVENATLSAAFSGCGLCQQTGQCDHAFRGQPGQFCIGLASARRAQQEREEQFVYAQPVGTSQYGTYPGQQQPYAYASAPVAYESSPYHESGGRGNSLAAGALGALGGLGVGAALGSAFGGHNNSGYSGDVGGVSDNTYTFSGDTGGGDFGGDGGDDGTFAGDS